MRDREQVLFDRFLERGTDDHARTMAAYHSDVPIGERGRISVACRPRGRRPSRLQIVLRELGRLLIRAARGGR
jgi:hypothetical protein